MYALTFTFTNPDLVDPGRGGRGVSGTVVVHWTAGQKVERWILHQGHDSYKIHPIIPAFPRPSIALQCRIVALNTNHFINPGRTAFTTSSRSDWGGTLAGQQTNSSRSWIQTPRSGSGGICLTWMPGTNPDSSSISLLISEPAN